jgi:hypothetical protein
MYKEIKKNINEFILVAKEGVEEGLAKSLYLAKFMKFIYISFSIIGIFI